MLRVDLAAEHARFREKYGDREPALVCEGCSTRIEAERRRQIWRGPT